MIFQPFLRKPQSTCRDLRLLYSNLDVQKSTFVAGTEFYRYPPGAWVLEGFFPRDAGSVTRNLDAGNPLEITARIAPSQNRLQSRRRKKQMR